MSRDEILMRECLKFAKRGQGSVSPNPLVGCIITKNNKIIGKGYHQKFGENHAEINAINDALSRGFALKEATMYVNLEPCSHFGKTPPCVSEIINQRFKKVVIGMTDPNPLVIGKGIKLLKKNGIEVTENVLEKECKEINKFFIKFITKKVPYVTLKIAQSLDGKIALSNYESKYITSQKSLHYVHELRSEYDAILIGKNTAKYDNPRLTTHGKSLFNPKRFIFDRNLELNQNLNIFEDENSTNTYRLASDKLKGNKYFNTIYFKEKNDKLNLKSILKYLYKQKISSVLVEGGANIFSQFIQQKLYDDIYFIIAPKIIGKGISPFDNFVIKDLSFSKILKFKKSLLIENDIILYYIK